MSLLDWQHDYVTKAGSQLPERIVQQLKRISREEADTLTGGLEKAQRARSARRAVQPAAWRALNEATRIQHAHLQAGWQRSSPSQASFAQKRCTIPTALERPQTFIFQPATATK